MMKTLPFHKLDAIEIHAREIDALIQCHPSMDPERIRTLYEEVLSSYSSAAIKNFIPILIRRRVNEILSRSLAR